MKSTMKSRHDPFLDFILWMCILLCSAPFLAVLVAATRPVNLVWDANTETDLAGYNVYRATGPRAFARINFATVPDPAYTDATAEIGQTYRYQVTALNTSGLESGPSNVVTVFVANPSPPSAPTGLTVSGLGSTAELRWDWNESADSYRVEYARGNSPDDWHNAGGTRENRATHKTGGPRWYRVVSIAGDRESAPSKAVYYHP